jgi:hypothetical protein
MPDDSDPKPNTTVTFVDDGDGDGPWVVSVNGRVVIDELPSGHMDVSDHALTPLWKALGVDVQFQWRGKEPPS